MPPRAASALAGAFVSGIRCENGKGEPGITRFRGARGGPAGSLADRCRRGLPTRSVELTLDLSLSYESAGASAAAASAEADAASGPIASAVCDPSAAEAIVRPLALQQVAPAPQAAGAEFAPNARAT